MGGAEITVIEWTSVWDDRGAMEVRDGERYWGAGHMKRKGRSETAGEREMGEVEGEEQWWNMIGCKGLGFRFWE